MASSSTAAPPADLTRLWILREQASLHGFQLSGDHFNIATFNENTNPDALVDFIKKETGSKTVQVDERLGLNYIRVDVEERGLIADVLTAAAKAFTKTTDLTAPESYGRMVYMHTYSLVPNIARNGMGMHITEEGHVYTFRGDVSGRQMVPLGIRLLNKLQPLYTAADGKYNLETAEHIANVELCKIVSDFVPGSRQAVLLSWVLFREDAWITPEGKETAKMLKTMFPEQAAAGEVTAPSIFATDKRLIETAKRYKADDPRIDFPLTGFTKKPLFYVTKLLGEFMKMIVVSPTGRCLLCRRDEDSALYDVAITDDFDIPDDFEQADFEQARKIWTAIVQEGTYDDISLSLYPGSRKDKNTAAKLVDLLNECDLGLGPSIELFDNEESEWVTLDLSNNDPASKRSRK